MNRDLELEHTNERTAWPDVVSSLIGTYPESKYICITALDSNYDKTSIQRVLSRKSKPIQGNMYKLKDIDAEFLSDESLFPGYDQICLLSSFIVNLTAPAFSPSHLTEQSFAESKQYWTVWMQENNVLAYSWNIFRNPVIRWR